MGQAATFYRGKTWRVQQALGLKDKAVISLREAAAILEGGRVCTEQGVNILAENRGHPETAKIVNALADTSKTLIQRVRRALVSNEAGFSTGEAAALQAGLQEIERDSFFLAHWARHLADHGPEVVYNA